MSVMKPPHTQLYASLMSDQHWEEVCGGAWGAAASRSRIGGQALSQAATSPAQPSNDTPEELFAP